VCWANEQVQGSGVLGVTSFDVRGFLVCAEAAGVVWSEDLLGKCRLAAGWV
jgi:hypothetical protein